MPRMKGSSGSRIQTRRDRVFTFYLMGLTTAEMARQLNVTERTIQYDVQEIRLKLSQAVDARSLRTLQHAYAQWNELWRQCWVLYTRKPTLRKDGSTSDDRFIKLACMDRLIRIADAMDTLTALKSKAAERTIILESRQPLQIQRLTFEEQLARGVEELKNNPGLAAAEGLTPEDMIEDPPGPVFRWGDRRSTRQGRLDV